MNFKEWVEKADRDLKLAKLAMENDILDYALFHAQQAVEKYLKSFLVKNKVNFRKKHDIFYLLGLCIDIDKDFSKLLQFDLEIFESAIAVRYPSDFYPDINTVKRAIAIAENVRDFVLKKLEVHKEDF